MDEASDCVHTITNEDEDDTTSFFDPQGTSEYCCRLGFNTDQEIDTDDISDESLKIFLTNLNDTIQSNEVQCSQRETLFDVYLKVVRGSTKLSGSVHGRFFKHLVERLHLKRPLQLQLTIFFDNPLNKIVVTKEMKIMSFPRDNLWSKAFKFEMELEGAPWTIPRRRTSVSYSLNATIGASLFIPTRALGIIPQSEDGECALMNKKFLEKGALLDLTLVSGNGKDRVQCHKLFLDGSSLFFERMLQTNMKEGNLGECQLEGSTKAGLEALLKFIYYRNVEDALGSSALAFELLHLGHMYDIPRLEGTMRNLLLAKLDDWWDLEVALELFLRTRMLEDDDRWQPLKEKVENVLKMKSAELTSDSDTLLDDLWKKDPKAAKELTRLISNLN